MDQPIDVATFIASRRERLLGEAGDAVRRAHLAHYEAVGGQATDERLAELLDIVIGACREHHLDGALSYADTLAERRHDRGYPLSEVQTAINVLEEAVWRSVIADAPPAAQGYALGLVSTVLGAVKDRVACGYIARVGAHPVRSLQVDWLFAGTEGYKGPA